MHAVRCPSVSRPQSAHGSLPNVRTKSRVNVCHEHVPLLIELSQVGWDDSRNCEAPHATPTAPSRGSATPSLTSIGESNYLNMFALNLQPEQSAQRSPEVRDVANATHPRAEADDDSRSGNKSTRTVASHETAFSCSCICFTGFCEQHGTLGTFAPRLIETSDSCGGIARYTAIHSLEISELQLKGDEQLGF